jgi:uncharacterized protein
MKVDQARPVSKITVALAAAVAAVIALGGCGGDGDDPKDERAVVNVGGAVVRADVAADQATLERGLSGRDSLAPDAGMLFLLPNDSPAIWMKGMKFPIDVVWIKDGRVVDVTADLPPPDGPGALPTYSPDRPANRALEVNAGWAARNGIARGDTVRVREAGGAASYTR